MTVWQILKTAPFSRLSAAERREWMKMAFYSQLVAFGFRTEWPSVHPIYTHSPNKLRTLWSL